MMKIPPREVSLGDFMKEDGRQGKKAGKQAEAVQPTTSNGNGAARSTVSTTRMNRPLPHAVTKEKQADNSSHEESSADLAEKEENP